MRLEQREEMVMGDDPSRQGARSPIACARRDVSTFGAPTAHRRTAHPRALTLTAKVGPLPRAGTVAAIAAGPLARRVDLEELRHEAIIAPPPHGIRGTDGLGRGPAARLRSSARPV